VVYSATRRAWPNAPATNADKVDIEDSFTHPGLAMNSRRSETSILEGLAKDPCVVTGSADDVNDKREERWANLLMSTAEGADRGDII